MKLLTSDVVMNTFANPQPMFPSLPSEGKIKLILAEPGSQLTLNLLLFFQSKGHLVAHLFDWSSAQKAALDRSFDILLIGPTLSERNGVELVKHLRNGLCQIPVIFLGADSDTLDKMVNIEKVGADHVKAPLSFSGLMERVNQRLQKNMPLNFQHRLSS